jgi:hypothetical protein
VCEEGLKGFSLLILYRSNDDVQKQVKGGALKEASPRPGSKRCAGKWGRIGRRFREETPVIPWREKRRLIN